jgi:hypothetical protein
MGPDDSFILNPAAQNGIAHQPLLATERPICAR